ncbi:MAG TPA: glucokinase [Terriglobales bacterium]|jgi:glucokinase
MILAGDIGGTNTRLALFDSAGGHFRQVSGSVFPSRQYSGLDEIVVKFVAASKIHPSSACFGIAGPVQNGRVEATNLPWIIEARRLADVLNLPDTLLINDVEASAWGIVTLNSQELVSLNKGRPNALGNQAVIAAGTGLGEAGLYWDGARHHVFATEGGHTDFGPTNDLEWELMRYVRGIYDRVSYERILSGPGLVHIFDFLRETGRGTPAAWLREEMAQGDPAAAISRAGLDGKCGVAEQALDLFVVLYGREAANLVLKMKALGGVFLAGGIAPKILPKLTGPRFLNAYLDKGRMRPLLEATPVQVIINDKLALVGAARCATVNSPTREGSLAS